MGIVVVLTPNDEQQARSWKLGAAHYGLYLEHGKGVRQNQEEAARYFKLSGQLFLCLFAITW